MILAAERNVDGQFIVFRIRAVYLGWVLLHFFSILPFRRVNNLRTVSPPEQFDSHPEYQPSAPAKPLKDPKLSATPPRRRIDSRDWPH